MCSSRSISRRRPQSSRRDFAPATCRSGSRSTSSSAREATRSFSSRCAARWSNKAGSPCATARPSSKAGFRRCRCRTRCKPSFARGSTTSKRARGRSFASLPRSAGSSSTRCCPTCWGRTSISRSAIGRLSASGLICQSSERPRLGYRFTHALTQEVSYESLLAHQRKSIHEAIGRAIERHDPERLDEQAALLAHHYCRAEAWRDAVHYGRRAAERAAGLSQFSDAFDTLEQLLEWLPHLPDDDESRQLRADLLLQQERACETMGLRRRQQEIVGRLIAHLAPGGPSARLAEAYLREGDLLTLLKRFNAADRALSTALRISRELEDARLERNILRSIGLLRWHEGRIAEALTQTEDALAIDRECGDEDAVAGDLVNLASILKSMGDYPAALSRVQEALAMLSVAENPKKLSFALHNLANIHRGMGNLDATLDSLRLADQNSEHLLPVHRSFHLTSIAHMELQLGHIDVAIRTYQQAIELSRRAHHAEGLAQGCGRSAKCCTSWGNMEKRSPTSSRLRSSLRSSKTPRPKPTCGVTPQPRVSGPERSSSPETPGSACSRSAGRSEIREAC